MEITKAVFPLAGFGSRMLPMTKYIPKEMLPVVNKPLLQYAIDETLSSGIYNLIFVVRNNNDLTVQYLHSIIPSIEKKFLPLKLGSKLNSKIRSSFFVTQKKPLGLGHAVYCVKDLIDREAFAVILADDLIKSKEPVLGQMLKHFKKLQSSIIAVSEIEKKHIHNYGILNASKPDRRGITRIKDLIEKPLIPKEAPSNLAITGRYILTSDIFTHLKNIKVPYNKEIQLTDAIKKLIKYQPAYGYKYKGNRFDCGSKIGFQKAKIAFNTN